MSQSSTFTNGTRVPQHTFFVTVLVLAFLFAGGAAANAQTPFAPPPTQSPAQPTAGGDSSAPVTTAGGSATPTTAGSAGLNSSTNSSTNTGNLTPSFCLSSGQII